MDIQTVQTKLSTLLFGGAVPRTPESTEGKWILKKGWKIGQGQKTSVNETGAVSVVFVLNPHSVTLQPKMRMAVQETYGGRVTSAWIDPESGTSVGNIDIILSGTGNIYHKKIKPPSGVMGRNAVLQLMALSMSPIMKPDPGNNNLMRRQIWELTCMTPLVYLGTGIPMKSISLIGDIITPMTVRENADDPWKPSWDLTFTLYGGQIRNLFRQLGVDGYL